MDVEGGGVSASVAPSRKSASETVQLAMTLEAQMDGFMACCPPSASDHALAAKVLSQPSSAAAWWELIVSVEKQALAARAGAEFSMAQHLPSLYRWATRLASQSPGDDFLRLWLGFVRMQWQSSREDARDALKALRSHSTREGGALLFYEWAALEHGSGDSTKASEILSKGLRDGASPAALLERAAEDLAAGRFTYRPLWLQVGKAPGGENFGPPTGTAPSSAPAPAPERGGVPATPTLCVRRGPPPSLAGSAAPLGPDAGTATRTWQAAGLGLSLGLGSAQGGRTRGLTCHSASTASSEGLTAAAQRALTPGSAGSGPGEEETVCAGVRGGGEWREDTLVVNREALRLRTISRLAAGGGGGGGGGGVALSKAPSPAVSSRGGGGSIAAVSAELSPALPQARETSPAAFDEERRAREIGLAASDGEHRAKKASPMPAPTEAADAALRPGALPRPRRIGMLGRAMRVAPGEGPGGAAEEAPSAEPSLGDAARKRKAEQGADSAGAGPAEAPAERRAAPAAEKPGGARAEEEEEEEEEETVPVMLSCLAQRVKGGRHSLAPSRVAADGGVVVRGGRVLGEAARGGHEGDGASRERPFARVVAGEVEVRGGVPLRAPSSETGGGPSVSASVSASASAAASAAASAPVPAAVSATVPAAAPGSFAAKPPAPSAGLQRSQRPPASATAAQPRAGGRRVIEDENCIVVKGITYTKLECVGRGGSSKVYKVMAPNRKIFALKRIRLTGRDAEAASGFVDEISLLHKLKGHKNIIQLIDAEVHKQEGMIYMVLEFGDIDLARLLQRHLQERSENPELASAGPDENFVRLYWEQMLRAVRTIHQARIVHSDLKPANFLLVEGQLKLIDFGIAKSIQADTTSIARESQVGTLNYMSPEAILGGTNNIKGGPPMKVGRPSDIWSLGCILYQMVYGHTPFSHLPFIQKMHAITNLDYDIDFPPVRNALLLDVIRRCLDRDPRSRISMSELLSHALLRPDPAPAAAPSASGSGQVVLSEEQLRRLLLKVADSGVAAPDLGRLSAELFGALAQGKSPQLASRSRSRASSPSESREETVESAVAPGSRALENPVAKHAVARPPLLAISQADLARQAAALRPVDKAEPAPPGSQAASASQGMEDALRRGLRRFHFADAGVGEDDTTEEPRF